MLTDYSSNTRFTKEEKEILSSQFLDFGDIWNISIALIKRNFKAVFLFPALWQAFAGFLVILLISFSFGASLVGYLNFQNKESFGSDYGYGRTMQRSNYNYPGLLNANAQSSLGLAIGYFFFVILIAIVSAIISQLIIFRQLYILNNSEINSIWKTPRGFYIDFLKIMVIGFLYFIGSLVVSAVFGAVSESLSSIASIVYEVAFAGLFGQYVYFVIFHEQDIIESLKSSYELMKPVFWKNVLRWLILSLIFIAAGLGFMLVGGIVFAVLFYMGFSSGSSIFAGAVLFFGMVLLYAFALGLNMIRTSFAYISFYNIRSIKNSEVKNTTEVKPLEVNNKPEEKTESVIKE